MSKLEHLPIDEVNPDPKNPRERFPDDELTKLSESIDQIGVLVPIVVYAYDGGYRILDGERRWRCSLELGLASVPALIVEEPTEENRLKQMFNIHLVREPWQDIPTAHALKKLMDETGVSSPSELARITGLSSNQIQRYQFALDLSGEIRRKVEAGEVPLNFFYEVYKAVVRPLEKHRPRLFSEYGNNQILENFLAKRMSGAVPDVVSVRDAQYIIRKAAEDDPEGTYTGALDDTLRDLLQDENLSVREAYEDTVMVTVEADKLQKRADGMVTAFKRLFDRAADDEQRENVRAIGRNLIKNLTAVVEA